jgi:hypothetical protein
MPRLTPRVAREIDEREKEVRSPRLEKHCGRQDLHAYRVIVEERERFLRWISEIPFEKIHENIYAKKHPGTGDWLLQTPQFQDWFNNSGSALLWCYGKREYYDHARLLEADGQQLMLANRCLREFPPLTEVTNQL